MNAPDLKDRIRCANWVAPSAELRARILAEARVAHDAITWTDRIWFSRAWRRSALGTAVALLAIAVWPGPGTSAPELSTDQGNAIRVAEEVARDAGLEPEQAAAVARRALARSRSLARLPALPVTGALSDGGDR